MTESLVQAIEGGAINTWVLSTYWLWPLLEIIHFIGLFVAVCHHRMTHSVDRCQAQTNFR